jgi:hypothetical protein
MTKNLKKFWKLNRPSVGNRDGELIFIGPRGRPIPKSQCARSEIQAPFRCTLKCQNFRDFPSHRIFRRMHEALNINKK